MRMAQWSALVLWTIGCWAGSALAGDVPGWHAFVSRNATSDGTPPSITDHPDGGKVFGITKGGQKAAWATSLLDGTRIGDIQTLSIVRDPSVTGYGPYMNFWVTDGLGGYAVLANEPSHTSEWLPGTPYNTTWDILQNATAWVYEVSGSVGFKLPNGNTTYTNLPAGTPNPFTFGNFANYLISPPTTHWGGSGAPDDLNASTYTAYGFNWVFGDTQSNYIGGYLASEPSAVPEPGTAVLLLAGAMGFWFYKRRRR